jgi:iron complex transport system substrate-binding protein
MSVGSSSFINDVIREAGAINIFSDIAAAYPVVSEESIIARNPSLILLPADSPENWESLSKRTGWQSIDAIQNKKVIKIDGDLISRPGPRIGEAIRAVQEALQ